MNMKPKCNRSIARACHHALLVLLLASPVLGHAAWQLVWSDEFAQADGSSPNAAKWAFDIGAGGWGNSELEYYTSRTNNARIEGGQLVIEAKQESYLGSSYTSARLKTQGKVAWAYGRIEARIKIPRSQGIWPAFWMLGTNITSVSWPNCGEIDIMENIGREPTLVHGTIHGPGYSGGSGIGDSYSLPGNTNFADDFHIYALEWTTNQIKWFVDGLQYFSVNPASLPGGTAWVFTQPQFLLLNVAVGGSWPGNPDGTTIFPQRMTVDYVRVYAPTNLAACSTIALLNSGFESGGLANWTTYGNTIGNTLLGNISSLPVHDGTNVFKVYGQFSGGDNLSGTRQDIAATPGQSFTASGWVFTQPQFL
ncbi:MAG: glycosyl hydrolase family protein, partial [Comamonadaceae bacterium]